MNPTRIPIQFVRGVAVVSIQVDLHDQLALGLQDDLIAALTNREAQGAIIDVSALTIVDTFVARILVGIAQSGALVGRKVVVVGIQPPVAMTLVELGISLTGVATALDIDHGFAILDELRANSLS